MHPAWLGVEKALNKVEGVTAASVNLATETAQVSGSNLNIANLIQAVKKPVMRHS